MQCITCETPIVYDPFYCVLCESPLCLFCSDKNEAGSICDRCVSSQELVPERSRCKHKKYHRQGNEWFEDYLCSCGSKMTLCRDHAYICKYSGLKDFDRCSELLCLECSKTGYCKGHREKCKKCKRWTNMTFLKTCPICKMSTCNTCSPEETPMNICKDHLEACHHFCKGHNGEPGTLMRPGAGRMRLACDTHARFCYTAPFKCIIDGCGRKTCTSCWFENEILEQNLERDSDTIKVCHTHRDRCPGCDKYYPVTKRGIIKSRGGRKRRLCINCFRHTRYFIECIIFIKKFPEDVIDLIVVRMIKDLVLPEDVKSSKKLVFDLDTTF